MPEYLSPGVYVEEVPSTIKPIVGVSTSTAAFVGVVPDIVQIPEENPDYDPNPAKAGPANLRYRTWTFPFPDADLQKAKDEFAALCKKGPDGTPIRPSMAADPGKLKDFRTAREKLGVFARRAAAGEMAPEGKPILCTTFAQFRGWFGDFSTDPNQNKLVHGVYGFFNNGGTRCYVMRYHDMQTLKAPTALAPLEAIDEISMVVAPGICGDADADVIQENIIDHCENLHDRVAILDAPPNPDQLTVDDIKVMNDTDYGAVYFPRIKVFDVVTSLTGPEDGDGEIYVSPSGHMAGIYARVDETRGVHKAPANEPVRGALPHGVEHNISKAQQDGLNPDGINCIRDMNGQILVWGARTIGGDMNFDTKYISTRRLLIFLEKSIDHGTQWVVFEPNDQSLWAKIVRNVSAFLTTVWRDGALFGATPQEAFYVKCDEETNPQEERDLGRVITEIGVAIVKPAEFVIFRIQQVASPATPQ